MVQDQARRGEARWIFEFGFEGVSVLGSRKGVDDVNRVGEEHAVAARAGGTAECGGEMGFADYAAPGIIGTMPGTGLCRVV